MYYDLNESTSVIKSNNGHKIVGSVGVKHGFPHMLKHGVVMDVTNAYQASIAEEAGAVAVMVLDKLPADIRSAGGIARTANIDAIQNILDVTSIPVMAKCRIGHTQEAILLEALGVDMVDESEVLTPADHSRHVWKWDFTTPFVNGCRDLGEALRRVEEGSSMLRTKGEAGTGDINQAVKHMSQINEGIRKVSAALDNPQELMRYAREMRVSYSTALEVALDGTLPIVNFAAGGIATPADAALMMSLGCDGVFVGSGIYKSEDPEVRAEAIVRATSFWDRPDVVLEAQKMTNESKSMMGIDVESLPDSDLLQLRGSEI